MECSGFVKNVNVTLLLTTQFTYQEGLGTCDALLCMSIHCKVHWRVGRRQGLYRLAVPIDRVIHQEILYKLCSVGIGGSVLLTQLLSNRSQHVIVESCLSKLVNIMSGVQQGSVLGQLLLLLYTEHFSILENMLIGYAEDSTLIAVVPIPGIIVTESLSNDLIKVIEWCDLWGMKLNVSKTKTMIVSR